MTTNRKSWWVEVRQGAADTCPVLVGTGHDIREEAELEANLLEMNFKANGLVGWRAYPVKD